MWSVDDTYLLKAYNCLSPLRQSFCFDGLLQLTLGLGALCRTAHAHNVLRISAVALLLCIVST
jgi:hypothetical protein